MNLSTEEGVFLPTYTPRWMPWLKGIAGLTVFIFTFTSILPNGCAQSQKPDTLRPTQVDQSPEQKAGLEEKLRTASSITPAAPVSVPAVEPVAAQPTPAQAESPSIWEQRNPPQITRRDALKSIGAATAALAAGAAAVGAAAAPKGAAPQPRPVLAPNQPFDGTVVEYNLPTGLLGQRGNVVVNVNTRQMFLPQPTALSAPRGMKATKSFWQAFGDQWDTWGKETSSALSRFMGWEKEAPDVSEVWTRWNPARFRVRSPDALPSYVFWGPWLTDEKWWSLIFQGIRKAADVGPRQTTDKPHSRIYVDPYGAFQAFRPWNMEGYARFISEARKQGIEVVPVVGDPLMAAFPTAGTYLMRAIEATTALSAWEKDGVRKMAFDIEPHDLDDYRTASVAQKVEYWHNVMQIITSTRDKLNQPFEQAGRRTYDKVEITLFVPAHFILFAEQNGIQVPEGTRLEVMAYSNRVEGHTVDPNEIGEEVLLRPGERVEALRLKKDARINSELYRQGVFFVNGTNLPSGIELEEVTLTRRPGDPNIWVLGARDAAGAIVRGEAHAGVVDIAKEVRDVFIRDVAQPENKKLFKGVRYSIAVDVGPALDANVTLWQDPEKPYNGSLAERIEEASRRLTEELVGRPGYSGGTTVHTHTSVDLIQFLNTGGPRPTEAASRELKEYFDKFRRRLNALVSYLAGRIHNLEVTPYGALSDSRPESDKAERFADVTGQGVVAGGVGVGALLANIKTLRDSIVRRTMAIDPEMFLFGPDVGTIFRLFGMVYSENFGQKARIDSMSRVIVDPSDIGEEITLGPGETATGVKLKDRIQVHGRWYEPGTVLIGEWDQSFWFLGTWTSTTLPAGFPIEKVDLKEGDKLHGTRLPDGTIVPGRAIINDPEVLESGADARSEKNRLRQTQMPASGYDLYSVFTVRNLEDPAKTNKPFVGYIQHFINMAYGGAHDLNSDPIELAPGEVKTYVTRLRVGEDDYRFMVEEDQRSVQDPTKRRGRLLPDVPISDGVFLVNTAADEERKDQKEIVDAVGEAGFDWNALEKTLRDQRFRAEFVAGAQAANRAYNFSEMAPYALKRPIAERVRLERGGSWQDAVDLVRRVAAEKHRHGITHLLVDSPDLIDLVGHVVRRIRQPFGLPDQAVTQDTRLYKEMMRDPETKPKLIKLFMLLHEAHEQGLDVGFLIRAEDAVIPADRADAQANDPRGTKAFFRILKDLNERIALGLDTLQFTAVEGHGSLRPEDVAFGVLLYQNAEAPVYLLGGNEGSITVGGVRAPLARDLSALSPTAALQAMGNDSRSGQPLEMAIVTPNQTRRIGNLDPAQVEERIVTELVGPVPEEGVRYSAGGFATMGRLADEMKAPRPYVTGVKRIVRDVLDLRTITPLVSGNASFVAGRRDPGNATRPFYLTIRLFEKSKGVLRSTQIPVSALQVDPNEALNVWFQEVPAGVYSVSMEWSTGATVRAIPGQPQISNLPLVVVEREPAFSVVNPEVDNWVTVGSRRFNFQSEKPGAARVEGADELLQDHWTVATETGEKLHVARNPTRDKVVYWTEGNTPQQFGVDTSTREASRTVRVGTVQVQIGMDRSTERVTLRVAGENIQLWSVLDQKLASRWDGAANVTQDGKVIKMQVNPGRREPLVTVLGANTPLPAQSTTVPQQVRDTTAERVTPHSDRGAYLGTGMAYLSTLLPAGAFLRSFERRWWKTVGWFRDQRKRAEIGQAREEAAQRASARAQARGEVVQPAARQTASAQRPVQGWIGGLGKAAWLTFWTAVTVLFLLQVPSIGYLMVNGGFSTAQAALVKVLVVGGLSAALVRGYLEAFTPSLARRIKDVPGVGTLFEALGRVGSLVRYSTIGTAIWYASRWGLNIAIPLVGVVGIPKLSIVASWVGALQPLAFTAAYPPVLVGVAGVAAAVLLVWGIARWEATRLPAGETGFWAKMNRVAPWLFRFGVLAGVLFFFGVPASLAEVTVGLLLQGLTVFGMSWYLGYLIFGNLLPAAIPGIPLLTVPRVFEGIAGLQLSNTAWQNQKLDTARRWHSRLDFVINRTPLSFVVGVGGVWLLAKLPWILSGIPKIGGVLGKLFTSLYATPVFLNILTFIATAALTGLILFALWRKVVKPALFDIGRLLPAGRARDSIVGWAAPTRFEYLNWRFSEDMARSRLGRQFDPSAAQNRQLLAPEYLAAVDRMLADREITVEQAAKMKEQIGQAAGLEEDEKLDRYITRQHAIRQAREFFGIEKNRKALGVDSLEQFIGQRTGEMKNLMSSGGLASNALEEVRGFIPQATTALAVIQERLQDQLIQAKTKVDRDRIEKELAQIVQAQEKLDKLREDFPDVEHVLNQAVKISQDPSGTLRQVALAIDSPADNVPKEYEISLLKAVRTAQGLAQTAQLDAQARVLSQQAQDLEKAVKRIRAPEVLLNGLAFGWQPSEVILQLDMGAKFAHEPHSGLERTAPPWWGTMVRDVIRRIKQDPSVQSLFPGIFVFPGWEPKTFHLGFQALGTPVVFLSQAIQYDASMFVRKMLSLMPGSQIRSMSSFVRSDMDPEIIAFASETQGRWLTGHLFRFIMKGLSGKYFHYEPESYDWDSFFGQDALKLPPGGYQANVDLMRDSPDIAAQIAGQWAGIPTFKNEWYKLGEMPSFGSLELMDYGVQYDGPGTEIRDNEALGLPAGESLPMGVKVAHLYGRNMNGVEILAPVSLEVRTSGDVAIADHPAKFDARFGPNLERTPERTPKSVRMALALGVILEMYSVKPEVDKDGNVALKGVTPWSNGDAKEFVEAHDNVIRAVREQGKEANGIYRQAAPRYQLNQGWSKGGSAGAEEQGAGLGDLGARMGWNPQDWRGGRLRQALYRIADYVTLRRWALSSGETGWFEKTRRVAARLWYYISPPLWVGLILFFNGNVGWLGLVGLLALSRFFLEPMFSIAIGVTFWSPRADPIISSYRYEYDPPAVVNLVERATAQGTGDTVERSVGLLIGSLAGPLLGVLAGMAAGSALAPVIPALVLGPAIGVLAGWLSKFKVGPVYAWGVGFAFGLGAMIGIGLFGVPMLPLAASWVIGGVVGTVGFFIFSDMVRIGAVRFRDLFNRSGIAEVPPEAQSVAGYREFLRRGWRALQADPLLYNHVIDLARGLSPERFAQNQYLPETEWERVSIEEIRPLFARIPAEDKAAAQHAILFIVMGHRMALDQPEELITALNYGSHDPGVPRPGDSQRVLPWFRDHEGRATPHSRIPELVPSQFRTTIHHWRRSWFTTSPATNVGGVRISSQHFYEGTDPLRAYLNDTETGLGPTQWMEEHSSLQPDLDELVRLEARTGRDILQGRSTPPAGAEEGAKQLRPVPAISIPFTGWKIPLVSAELWHSGLFHLGDSPGRFPVLDSVLYHISHWLDSFGWAGKMVNRAAGAGLSVGAAWWAGVNFQSLFVAHGALIGPAMAFFVGAVAAVASLVVLVSAFRMKEEGTGFKAGALYTLKVFFGVGVSFLLGLGAWAAFFKLPALIAIPVAAFSLISWVALAVVVLVAAFSLYSVFHSIGGKDGYRLDAWVDRDAGGWRGDGLRAVSLIPGLLSWFLFQTAFRTVLRFMDIFIPIKFPAWSWDAWRVARSMGESPDLFTGMYHRMDWPRWFTPIPPGLPTAKMTFWTAAATVWNASPISLVMALRLANEPAWTRNVTELNIGSSGRFVPETYTPETLAEDTGLNEELRLIFQNRPGLDPAGFPASPAVSFQLAMMPLWTFLTDRDNADALHLSAGFMKGMGMESASSILHKEDPLGQMTAQQQANMFASIFGSMEASLRNEVSTGGAWGAGVYSYLFTAFTGTSLYTRLVGSYAPGELEALLWFRLFAHLDQYVYHGALAAQLEQILLDRGLLEGGRQIREGQTLADQSVRQRLLQGGFVDPRIALAAVWRQREEGNTGVVADSATFHLSQTWRMEDFKINLLYGIRVLPPDVGGRDSLPMAAFAGHREFLRNLPPEKRVIVVSSEDVRMETLKYLTNRREKRLAAAATAAGLEERKRGRGVQLNLEQLEDRTTLSGAPSFTQGLGVLGPRPETGASQTISRQVANPAGPAITTGAGSLLDDSSDFSSAALAVAPQKGDRELKLRQPVSGWEVGDRLAFRGAASGTTQQMEIRSISPDGRTLTLKNPLEETPAPIAGVSMTVVNLTQKDKVFAQAFMSISEPISEPDSESSHQGRGPDYRAGLGGSVDRGEAAVVDTSAKDHHWIGFGSSDDLGNVVVDLPPSLFADQEPPPIHGLSGDLSSPPVSVATAAAPGAVNPAEVAAAEPRAPPVEEAAPAPLPVEKPLVAPILLASAPAVETPPPAPVSPAQRNSIHSAGTLPVVAAVVAAVAGVTAGVAGGGNPEDGNRREPTEIPLTRTPGEEPGLAPGIPAPLAPAARRSGRILRPTVWAAVFGTLLGLSAFWLSRQSPPQEPLDDEAVAAALAQQRVNPPVPPAVNPPAIAPKKAPEPKVIPPKMAVPERMDPVWVGKVRAKQADLLGSQTDQETPRIKLIRTETDRAIRLRQQQAIALEDYHQQMAEAEKISVLSTRGLALEMLGQYLKAQGAGRPADWDAFQKTVAGQVDAQAKYLHSKYDFLRRRSDSYWKLNQVRIGRQGVPVIAMQDVELAQADAQAAYLDLGSIGLLRALYGDLKTLGLTPPPLIPQGIEVSVLPKETRLALESRARVMTSIRGRIRDLLQMEKDGLQAEIDIRKSLYQRAETAFQRRAISASDMDHARFLLAGVAPREALQGVLSAQQKLVMATEFKDRLPAVSAASQVGQVVGGLWTGNMPQALTGAGASLPPPPDPIVAAQKDLNRAAMRHTASLIRLSDARVELLSSDYRRTASAGEVKGVSVVSEADRIKALIAMRRSQIHWDFLRKYQRLDKELQWFGVPAAFLDGRAPLAGAMDIQSMVQPVLVGLPEVPGTPKEIRDRARKVKDLRISLFDDQVKDIELQIEGLRDTIERTVRFYNQVHVGIWGYQDAQDSLKQVAALEKLIVLRRAQQAVERAETEPAFRKAIDRYETALVDWVREDQRATAQRSDTLSHRVRQMMEPKFRASFSAGDIDVMEANAAVTYGRSRELQLQSDIYRLTRGKIPLTDYSRGATSLSAMTSPDNLNLLLDQLQQGTEAAIGVVLDANGRSRPALRGGEQWMYLAGPPVLATPNYWHLRDAKDWFAEIPAGRIAEGNKVMADYIQAMSVDLGSVIGAQTPGSLGAQVLVYGFSPMDYQRRSGFYRLVALKDGPVIDMRGFRVGAEIDADPETGGAIWQKRGDTIRPVAGNSGFVGANSYEFEWVPSVDGGGRYEKSVTGLTGWKIPLSEYESKKRETPVPTGVVSRTPEGLPVFGTFYRAGRQTIGPRGHARYGVLDEPGDRLPPMFVQTEAGEIWVVPEVRRVFNEETEQWVLTFHYHPIQPPAGEGRQQPVAPVVEPAPVPAEEPVVEEEENGGVPWGLWLLVGAGALATGAGIATAWKLRKRASGLVVAQAPAPVAAPAGPTPQEQLQTQLDAARLELSTAQQARADLAVRIDAADRPSPKDLQDYAAAEKAAAVAENRVRDLETLLEEMGPQAGLEERARASAFVRSFSEKYGLPVVAEGAVVPEYHVVAVTPSAAKDGFLSGLVGRPLQMGSGALVVVPEGSEPIQQLLEGWASKRVVIEAYRYEGREDPAMDLFRNLAEFMKMPVTQRDLSDGLTRVELLRQLLVNLIGQQAERIPEQELIQLEQALSVLA